MQFKKLFAGLTAALMLAGAAAADLSNTELKQQVFAAERGFAATMKQRDHSAFVRYLSDEAVFFNGPTALTGKEAVAKGWMGLYEKPEAPFSWEPDTVEVLASGTLALSSGPVYDPKGKIVARFNSIWRQEAPGSWRVVFDRGSDVCDCKKP
jgi:ketosteroid isomerase-like protein